MSGRRKLGSRARVFAIFLLQLVLAGAAPLADGRLEAEASHADVHLESEATVCGLGHDHLFCSLCRVLDAGATHAVPSADQADRFPVRPSHDAWLGDPGAGAAEATTRSPRAPPSA